MLSAREFTVGSIGNAVPLTLVIPRSKYEEHILIGTGLDKPVAFFLSGSHRFHWFESTGNEHWNGLLIPNVRIEVDENTLFDPNLFGPKLGTVVRKGTQLIGQATGDTMHFGRLQPIVLEDSLPATSNESVGFLKWTIVLGDGQSKRVLFEVTVERD